MTTTSSSTEHDDELVAMTEGFDGTVWIDGHHVEIGSAAHDALLVKRGAPHADGGIDSHAQALAAAKAASMAGDVVVTATGKVSRQDLLDQLAAAEADVADAERELGEIQLDGGDDAEASRRVADGRVAAAGARRLIEAFDVRLEAQRETARQQHEALREWRVLVWFQSYVDRVRRVIELRPQLEEAEQSLMALGSVREVSEGGSVPPALLNGLPESAVRSTPPAHGFEWGRQGEVAQLTLAECDRWRAQLRALVAEAREQVHPKLLAEAERKAAS